MRTEYLLPPHGHVRYVRHLGDDAAIVAAARVSYDGVSKGDDTDKKLLFYLFRNRHTSPFEQCSITFNLRLPIFVMRQLARHRTARYNEVSGRYTELPGDFYSPNGWRINNTADRQCSSPAIDSGDEWNTLQSKRAESVYRHAWAMYQAMLQDGVAREQARMVLPLATYTEVIWNIDIHNLVGLLRLRDEAHAQSEIRDVALPLLAIGSDLFPWVFEAYRRFLPVLIDTEKEKVTAL